jgi:hypothetical protein
MISPTVADPARRATFEGAAEGGRTCWYGSAAAVSGPRSGSRSLAAANASQMAMREIEIRAQPAHGEVPGICAGQGSGGHRRAARKPSGGDLRGRNHPAAHRCSLRSSLLSSGSSSRASSSSRRSPVVVLGFFGIAVLGEALRRFPDPRPRGCRDFPTASASTPRAACLLALMAIPTIFTLAEDAMNNVPRSFKEASFALGATRLQTIIHIIGAGVPLGHHVGGPARLRARDRRDDGGAALRGQPHRDPRFHRPAWGSSSSRCTP